MKQLGIDIGTTTVSAVVVAEGTVLSSLTLKNDSFLPSEHPWEKIQDPAYIRGTVFSAVDQLLEQHPDVARIGITGQMHGIVYLDRTGDPVSPLYTWQDGRGSQKNENGETYAQALQRLTGYPVSPGYGMVTHYYNLQNGLVPGKAAVFSTIQDYIAMLLTGAGRPVTDASDAASFGLFDVAAHCFDTGALGKAGISGDLLPAVAKDPCIGEYQGRIPVYVAIGDNQDSFWGATGGRKNAMLINVGTGSQFSVYTPRYMTCPGLETRPFPDGGYLLVGASLCGGRAYALLERFLRDVVRDMTGRTPDSCYEAMNAVLSGRERPNDLPVIAPLFQGTREDPTLRGTISNLTTENFTPAHFLFAMLEGMAAELYAMYLRYVEAGGKTVEMIGSGNGLRKNPHLQSCFSRLFGQPLVLSDCREEAATGAALFAGSSGPRETE